MSFNYRNFRKRISFSLKPGLDSLLVEVFVGIIFSVMAYHAFVSEMVIIAVPLGLLGGGCILAVIIQMYFYFADRST